MIRIWSGWLEHILGRQVADGSPMDGAFDEHGNGWYDGRYAALTLARLAAAWTLRAELTADDRRLEAAMRRAFAFLRRRQAPDGRLDLGGMYSPNEAGFTLPALCESFRRLTADGDRRWSAFLGELEGCIRLGAEAVLAGDAYTANHRWAAAAGPLACVNRLWPDDRYRSKIEGYLEDGIDCDADGCWREERSPNYNAVASFGILTLAENGGRPELLEVLKRHGEFVLKCLQPNGEMDSSFSHRQDRHKPECLPITYGLARRLAQLTGDGRYSSLALQLPERALSPEAELMPLPFQISRYSEPLPEPVPIGDHYEVHFSATRIARVRRGPSALTLAADAGGHFFDTVRDRWGGTRRSDDWFHLHHGRVVIETLQLGGAGMQNARPQTLVPVEPGCYRLRGEDRSWVHTQHFRPGSPEILMRRDWCTVAEVRWAGEEISVLIESGSPHSLGATLGIWVRAGVEVSEGRGAPFALAAGQKALLQGGLPVRLAGDDGRSVVLEGLPAAAHRADFLAPPSIPSEIASHCGCLRLGLHFPVRLSFKLHLSQGAPTKR